MIKNAKKGTGTLAFSSSFTIIAIRILKKQNKETDVQNYRIKEKRTKRSHREKNGVIIELARRSYCSEDSTFKIH
jgi:hypothetical protein